MAKSQKGRPVWAHSVVAAVLSALPTATLATATLSTATLSTATLTTATLVTIVLATSACEDPTDESREAQERDLREDRARRARAEKARQDFHKRWHEEYRQEIERATGRYKPPPSRTPSSSGQPTQVQTRGGAIVQPAPVDPPLDPLAGCNPWAQLEARTRSTRHLADFGSAVNLLLDHIKADLVTLDGRPHQRFLFALRMHPGEEPALGRRASREELFLGLRWVPLCQPEATAIFVQTLRFQLQRHRPGARPGARPASQIRLPGKTLSPLSPGVPVELFIDPTVSQLTHLGAAFGSRSSRSRSAAGTQGSPPVVGLWEITSARVPGRPRTLRLKMDTFALGERLRRISVVEVPCPAPGGACRFLTRVQGHRETPVELPALLRSAAPLTKEGEIRQLWAILHRLKFHTCTFGDGRVSRSTHPCVANREMARTEPCQYWLALNGHVTSLHIRKVGRAFDARQVLLCQGRQDRVISVDATFQRNGDLRLRETNLTERGAELEAELRRMTR